MINTFLKINYYNLLKNMVALLTYVIITGAIGTGGFCKLRVGKCVTIEIASKVMKKAFEHDGEKTSGNIKCDDILECLQLTFEHELIHGIMFCFCLNIERKTSKDIPGLWTGKTIKGHNKTFMSILNNLFGHTDYYHGLLKKSKSNCDIKLVKKLAKIGSTVKFEFEKNDEKISKIGVVTKKTSTKLHINVGKQEFKRWGEPPIVTDAILESKFFSYYRSQWYVYLKRNTSYPRT